MEQVTAYQATDGKLFSTVEQALEHEDDLQWGERIGEFVRSEFALYKNSAQQTIMKRSIIAWEKHKGQVKK
jgi:hypothetical protein